MLVFSDPEPSKYWISTGMIPQTVFISFKEPVIIESLEMLSENIQSAVAVVTDSTGFRKEIVEMTHTAGQEVNQRISVQSPFDTRAVHLSLTITRAFGDFCAIRKLLIRGTHVAGAGQDFFVTQLEKP